MKNTFAKMLKPTGILALCLAGLVTPQQVSAAASSSGRILFSSIQFMDLDQNDSIAPGITWTGGIDGSLDAHASTFQPHHPPVSDHKLVTTFASDSANASIGWGTSAKSSMTAGAVFFEDILSQGYTGPGGLYDSIAMLTGLFSLSPMTTVTFSGVASATATAGPSPADYANGYAYVLISALDQPPVDAVYCKTTNDNFCANPFSFTITNSTRHAAEVGYDLLTSVDGFSAPIPEPETWAILLAGLGLLGLSARAKLSKP